MKMIIYISYAKFIVLFNYLSVLYNCTFTFWCEAIDSATCFCFILNVTLIYNMWCPSQINCQTRSDN